MATNLKEFRLENLPHLDGGKAVMAFNKLVRRAAEDCEDRPGDPAARIVTLKVAIKPIVSDSGECYDVGSVIEMAAKLPPSRTKPYSFALRKGGVLAFNPDSLEDVDQASFLPEPTEDD